MSKRRRFAFVVVRYGDGVLGGAEAHCRAVVEHLAARGNEVRVLTTTARSYQTWRNEFAPGEDVVDGVRVTRFATRAPRIFPADDALKLLVTSMKQGASGLARLRASDHWSPLRRAAQKTLENAWIHAQGPVAPELVRALPSVDADVVVFFGYLYHPTIFGVPRVASRAVMAPLADEEPMLYAPIVRDTLRRTRALLMNVDEEAERVKAIVAPERVPMGVVALGIDPPPPRAGYARPTDAPFLLVLGRAGKTRPIASVWRAFTESMRDEELELDDGRRMRARELVLVTAGERARHLEGLPRVVQLGRVDEATRWGLVRDAMALVSPSVSESLSLVVLEAWLAGRTVIVNAACDVTDGHIRRSGGGASIDFTRPEPAARALFDAIRSKSTRDARAQNGKAYVERRYAWSSVMEAYEGVADAIAAHGPTSVGAFLREWGARHGAWTSA